MHAELTLGNSIKVSHGTVEMLMRRAGLQGGSGRPKYRRIPNMPTAHSRRGSGLLSARSLVCRIDDSRGYLHSDWIWKRRLEHWPSEYRERSFMRSEKR
jgi:hypothetical protein